MRMLRLNSLKTPALRTKSCWMLWNAPTARLELPWERTKMAAPRCEDASTSDFFLTIKPQLK